MGVCLQVLEREVESDNHTANLPTLVANLDTAAAFVG
jgi:hypothetical protein